MKVMDGDDDYRTMEEIMQFTKCKNGHFYDADMFSRCPHCVNAGEGEGELDKGAVFKQKPREKVDNVHIIERIMCWLFYSVFFSLLPIGINTALNSIFEFGIDNTDQYISDLFVVTLVISSTTLKDIIDNKFWEKKQTVFLVIFFITFFLILISSILCGAVTYCFLSGASLLRNIKNKLLILSTLVSVVSIVISLLMQILGGVVDGIQS